MMPPPKGASAALSEYMAGKSFQLIGEVADNARRTQRRIALTFTSYLAMLWLLFVVGIAAFVVAAVRGLTADDSTDAVATIVFGGLSATTFVTVFLGRPVRLMHTAGAQAAWLQSIVNTYWTKLGYLDDVDNITADLDKAQSRLNRDMRAYLLLGEQTDDHAGEVMPPQPRPSGESTGSPGSTPPGPTGPPPGAQDGHPPGSSLAGAT